MAASHRSPYGLAHAGRFISRRVFLRHCGALPVALSLSPDWMPTSRRALDVRVAPPTITRDGCTALVAVPVTISPTVPGRRFAVHGELWEADDPDGDPDFAGTLDVLETPSLSAEPTTVQLQGRFLTAALGLEKGVGPASDEGYSPDLVELFATVMLRDLATGANHGPWQSPLRVAVAQETRDWTGAKHAAGGDLALPRGSRQAEQPPRACIS